MLRLVVLNFPLSLLVRGLRHLLPHPDLSWPPGGQRPLLASSWFFFMKSSSSLRASISVSSCSRVTLVSSMTLRSPCMSLSTDWRMASSVSYLWGVEVIRRALPLVPNLLNPCHLLKAASHPLHTSHLSQESSTNPLNTVPGTWGAEFFTPNYMKNK